MTLLEAAKGMLEGIGDDVRTDRLDALRAAIPLAEAELAEMQKLVADLEAALIDACSLTGLWANDKGIFIGDEWQSDGTIRPELLTWLSAKEKDNA